MIYSVIDNTPRPNASIDNLESKDLIELHGFRLIRGVYSNGFWESALLTKCGLHNDVSYASLLLVSSVGVNQNNVDHHHISHVDANFAAYKTEIGVSELWISPVDESRISLIETRLPLWVRRGDTPNSGEPLFVRAV